MKKSKKHISVLIQKFNQIHEVKKVKIGYQKKPKWKNLKHKIKIHKSKKMKNTESQNIESYLYCYFFFLFFYSYTMGTSASFYLPFSLYPTWFPLYMDLADFLASNLNIIYLLNRISFNHILFMLKQLWKELEQYLLLFNYHFSPLKLRILVEYWRAS
jgi:hypothetical protein